MGANQPVSPIFRQNGFFFFSSRRRHTRLQGDWSSDVCSSDLSSPAKDGGVIAVTRALQLLGAFALGESHLSLAELSRRCALHKTTVLRLARTLAQSGFMEIGRASCRERV